MIRRAVRWLGAALLALLLLAGLALAFVHTDPGRAFVAARIGEIAPQSGLRISVGRIEGSVIGRATLHDVAARDVEGTVFLELPRVALDWRPWRWLWAGLDVREVVAAGGTLHAVPVLREGDPDAPILPGFDIHLGRLAIRDLTIAEGIAGPARRISFTASGDARAGRLRLDANGELGGGDVLSLTLDARPDGDAFDLDLDWRAPRGGLLAALAGLEADSTIRITGAGRWRHWDGHLIASSGEVERARLGLAARAGAFGVGGEVRPEGLVQGLAGRALGEVVRISAGGTLAERVLAGRLTLSGSGVAAEGQGAVDLGVNRFDDLAITATLRDPALLGAGVTLRDTRLEGVLDGPFRQLSIPHTLTIGSISAGTLRAERIVQRSTARWDGKRLNLPLRASVARVVTGNALADPRLVNGGIAGELVWQGRQLSTPALALRFQGVEGQLALASDLASGRTRITGPLSARGLELANLGTVDGRAEIDLRLGGGAPWALQAGVDGALSRVSNATLAQLAGPRIGFSGGLALGGARPVVFEALRINAARLSATLSGRVTPQGTLLSGSGQQAQYGPFRVEARLAPDGPRATLVFARPWAPGDLRDVHVTLAPAGDAFAITARGQSLLGPFDGAFGLAIPPGGGAQISIARLDVAQTRASGALRVVPGGLAGLVQVSRGGVEGTIDLSTRAGGQGFAVDLGAEGARFGGATPLSIARGTLQAEGLIVGGSTSVSGNASLQGVGWGRLFLGRLAARADVSNGSGRFDAAMSGRRGGQFALRLNGIADPGRVALAASGDYAGRAIAMPRRAVLLRQDDGGWALQESQLSFGEGFVIASGRFGGDAPLQARLALADMPLDLAGALAGDLDLGGSISGEVSLGTGADGLPVGEARVLVDDLTRSSALLTSQPLDVALVADLSETLLQARAVLRDGSGAQGRVQARIGNLPRFGPLAERLYAGELSAGLRFVGPAAALWRLVAVDLMDISGNLVLAANATGSLANPLVRGSLAGDDLRVQSALTGTDVSAIAARGVFTGSRLNLTRFAGTAAGGGAVSGSGFLDFSGMEPGRGPHIDLRLAARAARLIDLNNMGATVTGPLRILSDGNGGTIAGRVQVADARWRLGSSEALAQLPVVATREINLPLDAAPLRAPARPWRYLIDAELAEGVQVDGMGLDSRWAGTLRLRGTPAEPRIGGEVRVLPRQAFYSFAGVRFDITRGRITFDENGPLDPRVELLAETEVDDLAVAVSVQGSASRPDVTFTSTPALPQEELLARLLFGGSINSLSATDALQLGAAVAALQGGAGLDPINALRSAVGLDRLRIVPADPALGRGTALALGKNVTRRFYAEIVTDGAGYNASELEFRVTGWLSLLGTLSTVGRHAVAAEVRRDY